ncbi:hypothetical protein [Tenacibaculum ovolyticum]|nr:hypothetical protein [Tenacibaculum ovolyticum]
MKYLVAILGLTIWLLTTVILVFSIIGVIALIADEYVGIPNKLLSVFEN